MNFKKINDTFGHEIGDIVIKELVKISKNCIRDNDLIIRLGGDEFVILLPNTYVEDARKVAMKIIDKINEYNKIKSLILLLVWEYRTIKKVIYLLTI